MIAFEVLLRLLLTIFLIAVPLYIGIKKYWKPFVDALLSAWKTFSTTLPKEKEKKTPAKTIKATVTEDTEIASVQAPKAKEDIEENTKENTANTEEKTEKSTETPIETVPKEEEKKTPAKKTKPTVIDEKKHKKLERIKYAALTYKERGKLDQYEKKLIEWLALVPDHDEFLDMLSNHYFQQGSDVKALSLLKRVITLHPTHHKSIRQVGQIYRQQGKIDAWRLLIEKAIALKWDNPKYLISLVEIHYENKELKEAVGVMERLSKLRPTNVDYILTLWTLYEELHEPTNAQKYYMKVLELEPHNEHAKKSLKRLQS